MGLEPSVVQCAGGCRVDEGISSRACAGAKQQAKAEGAEKFSEVGKKGM